MALKHAFTCPVANDADPNTVGSTEWNDAHTIDTGGLTIPVHATAPTPPTSGNVTLFSKVFGGGVYPHYIDPDGVNVALQPHLGERVVGIYSGTCGNAINTGLGMSLTPAGTSTVAVWASTNLHQSLNRNNYLVTTAATTAVAGVRTGGTTSNTYWRGNAAGLGGFTIRILWGPSTGATVSTHRAFMGLRASSAAPTDVLPSTFTNCIGMGWEAGDANVQLYASGSAAQARINTGIARGTLADNTAVYEIILDCPPNVSYVNVTITNMVSGSTYTTQVTATANLPATTTGMNIYGYCSVGGTSSVVGQAIMSIYAAGGQ